MSNIQVPTEQVPTEQVKDFIAEAYALVRDFGRIFQHIDTDSDLSTIPVGEEEPEYVLIFPDETVEYNPLNGCFMLNEECNKQKIPYQILKVASIDKRCL